MNKDLQKIQQRLDEYKTAYKKVLIDFHHSNTLNYYNDRFVYENPCADDADRGIMIELSLKQIKKRIGGICKSI